MRDGRMRKAEQFLEWAENLRALVEAEDDYVDAYVTMCVHAGIAAADVICCARLAEMSKSTQHEDAVALLKKVDPVHSNRLKTLLSLKSKAGYDHESVSATDAERARRAAEALLESARIAAAA